MEETRFEVPGYESTDPPRGYTVGWTGGEGWANLHYVRPERGRKVAWPDVPAWLQHYAANAACR
jgi:hypothetical protein